MKTLGAFTVLAVIKGVAWAVPTPVECTNCTYVAMDPPCRLVDTRVPSPGTPLVANSSTGYNVRGNPASGQGGNASFCGTGSDEPFAVDVSIASLGAGEHESYGYMQVYRWDGAVRDGAQLTLSGGYWRSGQIRALVAPASADYDLKVFTTQGGHFTMTLVGYLQLPAE